MMRLVAVLFSLQCLMLGNCMAEAYQDRSTKDESVAASDVMFTLLDKKGIGQPQEIKQLYTDFPKFFRDLEVKILPNGEGTGESGSKNTFRIERKEAPEGKDGENERIQSLNKLVNNLSVTRWRNLMDVLTVVCKGGKDGKEIEPSKLYDAEDKYFETLETKKELFKSLSTYEVPFNEFIAKTFIELYMKQQKGKRSEMCDKFETYKPSEGSGSAGGDDEFIDVATIGLDEATNKTNNMSVQRVLNKYKEFVLIVSYHNAYSLMIKYYSYAIQAYVGLRPDAVASRDHILQQVLSFSRVGSFNDLYTRRLQSSQAVTKLVTAIYDEDKDYENSFLQHRKENN